VILVLDEVFATRLNREWLAAFIKISVSAQFQVSDLAWLLHTMYAADLMRGALLTAPLRTCASICAVLCQCRFAGHLRQWGVSWFCAAAVTLHWEHSWSRLSRGFFGRVYSALDMRRMFDLA
jgi:hypothetical protein